MATEQNIYLEQLAQNRGHAMRLRHDNGGMEILYGSCRLTDQRCSVDNKGRLHGEAYLRPPIMTPNENPTQDYYWHGVNVGRNLYDILKLGASVIAPVEKQLFKDTAENRCDIMTVEKILQVNKITMPELNLS
jgi:hypothetical protein